jgi:hypothetical protein
LARRAAASGDLTHSRRPAEVEAFLLPRSSG